MPDAQAAHRLRNRRPARALSRAPWPRWRRGRTSVAVCSFYAALGRHGVEEPAHGGEHFRLIEQEGVVTAVGADFDEADIGRSCIESVGDSLVLDRRKEPVA